MSASTRTADASFAHWASCPDAEIDLARAALAIARDEYPDLDPEPWVARLDALAAAVRGALAPGAGMPAVLAALDRQLFEVEGFAGNAQDYYDPRNSYLNDVLERRLGIPITLSVVYLETAWRLGVALAPLGFPGHFLVGLPAQRPALVIDPFDRARRLHERELLERLEPMVGAAGAPAALPRALAAVPRREVVARMLRNLKAIHVRAADWPRALRVTDRLVALMPGHPAELRDRGQLYERIEAHHLAVQDYARYLERAPGADDAEQVRRRIAVLGPLAARPN